METKVSVLLCAYNGEAYIAEAIKSTLAQTFQDFEFIIVDDGSTDNTLKIIRSFHDERMKVIEGKHDYICSLNLGLTHCHGMYIARMDADDIMMPNRLEKQVALMDAKHNVTVCASWAQTFGNVKHIIGNVVQGEVENINVLFLSGNFLIHPTCMIRRSFLTLHHLNYKDYPYAEDYKLWTDIAWHGGHFYVIPQRLIYYRVTPTQVTNVYRREQYQTRQTIQQEIIEKKLKQVPQEFKKRVGKLYRQLLLTYNDGILSADDVIYMMSRLFRNEKIKMS